MRWSKNWLVVYNNNNNNTMRNTLRMNFSDHAGKKFVEFWKKISWNEKQSEIIIAYFYCESTQFFYYFSLNFVNTLNIWYGFSDFLLGIYSWLTVFVSFIFNCDKNIEFFWNFLTILLNIFVQWKAVKNNKCVCLLWIDTIFLLFLVEFSQLLEYLIRFFKLFSWNVLVIDGFCVVYI